jgi:hypothetical protein
MAVTESWTDPDSLDRSTGDVLTEAIWDNTVSNLAYLGGQTATGVIAPQRIGLPVDNSTGGSLAAGTLVYVSGYDAATGAPQITKADADSRQAEYILNAAIANGAAGVAYRGYTLGSLDTSGSSVGDPIYLSSTAGSWSASAMTGAAQISQKVGVVVTSHASTGSIQFLLPGEMLKWGSGNLQSKSVAVAALADGTDGELITWSASAVAATVAVGTATHVLTSNGTGAAPTFQAAGSGGKISAVATLGAKTAAQTSTSTSYVDISDMTATLTTTKGGLAVWAFCTADCNAANEEGFLSLQLDSETEVGVVSAALGSGSTDQNSVLATGYFWTSVSDASHTVDARFKKAGHTGGTWRVDSGTLMMMEFDD